MPLDLAAPLVGPVVRINREFLLLPFLLASTLAGLPAAIALILYPRIGIKETSASGADPACPVAAGHKPLSLLLRLATGGIVSRIKVVVGALLMLLLSHTGTVMEPCLIRSI